jgi:hypothetical protein
MLKVVKLMSYCYFREEKDLNVRRVVSMCGNETKVMGCEKPFLYYSDFSLTTEKTWAPRN